MKTKILLFAILLLNVSCGKPKTGPMGPQGDSITGPQGNTGENGSDSDSRVTMINLCDNHLRENKFSEVGICISEGGIDRLFGVVSGTSSALSELLEDHEYTTSSPNGNNCRFYLGHGCEVKFIEEI